MPCLVVVDDRFGFLAQFGRKVDEVIVGHSSLSVKRERSFREGLCGCCSFVRRIVWGTGFVMIGQTGLSSFY
jgi:hypothetical protein